MPRDERKLIGKKGEELAYGYLRKLGYAILEKNYRCPFGEIDIIARDKKTLVFVEVKSRTTDDFGYPEEAVGKDKQRKIVLCAQQYLLKNEKDNTPVRFDVIAIKMGNNRTEITHFKDALEIN